MAFRKKGCEICRGPIAGSHICRQAVLNAIDSANSAAWNRELYPDTKPSSILLDPDYVERLKVGFRYLNG